jgi:hypothetical protein
MTSGRVWDTIFACEDNVGDGEALLWRPRWSPAWWSPRARGRHLIVGVSQVASADVVPAGGTVTYTVTVRNEGEPSEIDEHTAIDLPNFEVDGHGAVPNPYVSITPSQGVCLIGQIGQYHDAQCDLGVLGPAATVEIVAVVQVNESMDHVAAFIDPGCFGLGLRGSCGYADADYSDNRSQVRTIASSPPVLSGSKKIKIKGLPDGCASQDFTIKARAKGDVKKISAELVSAKQNEGFHEKLAKKNGNKLAATVPVGDLKPAFFYEIRVASQPGGKAIATFQRC